MVSLFKVRNIIFYCCVLLAEMVNYWTKIEIKSVSSNMFSFYSEIVYRWKERLHEYYKERANFAMLYSKRINYNFEIHTIAVILEWINNINLIIRPLKLMKNSIDSMTCKF